MTSANTLLKNILDVKGAVVQGADFSVDAHGVKKAHSPYASQKSGV